MEATTEGFTEVLLVHGLDAHEVDSDVLSWLLTAVRDCSAEIDCESLLCTFLPCFAVAAAPVRTAAAGDAWRYVHTGAKPAAAASAPRPTASAPAAATGVPAAKRAPAAPSST